jgi:hypothetical protein
MIDLAVRHYVYDLCLGIVFDKLNLNLVKAEGIPKAGQYYSRISHVVEDEHYYGCVITDVERRHTTDHDFYIVYFRYQKRDGQDLQNWLDEMSEVDELYKKQADGTLEEEESEMIEMFELDELMTEDDEVELFEYEDQVGVSSVYYTFHP